MSEPLPPPEPAKYLRAEMTPVAREFYRRLAETGRVATTGCSRCLQTSFPPRARCPRCGNEQSWIELPAHGRLYAFTTQETALRFGAPTVLALAELGPATLPGIVRSPYDELHIGQEVTARGLAEPETSLTLIEFVPVSGEPGC